jgi:hypothetical protein
VNQSLGNGTFAYPASPFHHNAAWKGIRSEIFQPPYYGRLADNLI